VRRLALFLAGGAVWLFLAAIPALADGGPHVAPANSGVSTLTADNCAGCHRAHTAQGPLLLAAPDEDALCLSCHGASGAGSAVDVQSGIQYTTASRTGGTVLGALRAGGYVNARIDSANPTRLTYNRTATETSQRTKVPVLAVGEPVTSAHIDFTAGVVGMGIAWGNGPFSATADVGPALADPLTCGTCHNPHGNDTYRILRPIPNLSDGTGPFVEPTTDAVVADAPLPAPGDTRNYTVIQVKGTEGTDSTYLLYASQVTGGGYPATAGDYFHRTVPWDPQVDDTLVPQPAGVTANDAPNGKPSTFDTQINAWCSQCHSRYLAGSGSFQTDSGDAVFRYRHTNTSNKPCTTCHVAHGSNASMTGVNTSAYPYPDGTLSPSSRLLKIDNRGTCQACHDPTDTVPAGTMYGPVPVPYVP
jgi:predicted CXXCH cytochrome family protein